MLINNNNITPSFKNIVKHSTMRQYLQIGLSLGLISYDDNKKWDNDDFFLNINPKFWQINCKNIDSELTDLFVYALFNSLDNHVSWTRNFGLSLFLSLIEQFDNTIFNSFNNDYFLLPKTNRNKNLINNKIYLSSSNGKEYIKHLRGLKTNLFGEGKNTYKTLCEKILSKYKFDDILDQMYKITKCTNDNDFFDNQFITNKKFNENKIKKDALDKYLNILNNKRCKLRENIIISRVGTIEDIIYSDIENSELNDTFVSSQEACHIYDIYKIKSDLSNYIIETDYNELNDNVIDQIIDKADDFNNGILLNRNCHKIFDKNYVWFNDEGKLIYLKECEQIVKDAFGNNLDQIYIKKRTLTE
ncbi:MAG: HNH endonuclease, partial [Ureaplasma sp.]|nr:HNH endonuclease [Ureaplasma sp.]